VPSELVIEGRYEGGMKVTAGDGEHSVTMDYPLEAGQELAGLTPLKALLASLAGCTGNTLPLLLKKRGQELDDLRITVRGLRRDEHPTVITEIGLQFVLRGRDLDEDVVRHCIEVAHERICPVAVMLGAAAPITTSYRIEQPVEA
jgi:putative redox protein